MITGEAAFLTNVLLGREDAVIFCQRLAEVAQVWDDLIDKDKPITEKQINNAFINCLLRIPCMPFYQDNFGHLQPVIQNAVYDWLTANELEQGNDHAKSMAFVLRDAITSVAIQCAFLVGGHEHAIEQGPKIRRFFHDEPLSAYMKGLEVQV